MNVPYYPSYTFSEDFTQIFNSKGKPVKIENDGSLKLWDTLAKKSVKLKLEDLVKAAQSQEQQAVQLEQLVQEAEVYEEPMDLWGGPVEPHEEPPLSAPAPPLDEAWDEPIEKPKARGKVSEEAVHRICQMALDGHSTPTIVAAVKAEFPDLNFSRSLVADTRSGWLHHSIGKQYGIKPKHRSLKKITHEATA
jgi:hypothetical protein